MAKKCREKNMLMPVVDCSDYIDGYEGAAVIDPKVGIWNVPIAVSDYKSLYPSTMIAYKLSPDTLVWSKKYDNSGTLLAQAGEQVQGRFIYDNLPEYSYLNITHDTYEYHPKGKTMEKVKTGYMECRFAQFDGAIMPSILEELLDARKKTRTKMKTEKDAFMLNVLEQRQ
jgi:DNA polymerase elongation subunit (family B)